MTKEERNAAADSLFHNPEVDIEQLIRDLSTDFPLCCQLLFITHDPRRKPYKFPFKLWDYQKDFGVELEDAIVEQYPLLCEKSRDLGVTEEVLAKLLQRWAFDDDFHALITSRKEELIDSKHEPDTLFQRLRMKLANMPPKFRDVIVPGYDETKNATYMRLVHPVTGNTITGEAPVDDFGRQGRYTVILYDEAASIENLATIRASAGDSANCHIYTSTPKGINEFARLRKSKSVRIVTIHWMQHPLKAKGLYKKGERIIGAVNDA